MTAIVRSMITSSRCRWLVAPGRWRVRGRVERFVEPVVLLALAEGPRHGYELREQVIDAVEGDRADVTNLYRVLRQLELEGIVRSTWDTAGGGPARRVYRLSKAGRTLLAQWALALREMSGPVEGFLARHERLAASHG